MTERQDLLPHNAARSDLNPAAAVFTVTDETTPATNDTPGTAPLAPLFHANNTMHHDLAEVSVATTNPNEPRLPSGAVIDAKNTLQSFVGTDITRPAPANLIPNPPPTDTRDEDTPSTVVAVAVVANPSVLYAEAELISSPSRNLLPPEISWYKRRSTLLILLVLALLAAAGMGVYIGTSSGKATVAPAIARRDALTSYVNSITLSNRS